MLFNKEPVLIITTIVTIVAGAIATLTGNGLISDVTAGKATDAVNGIGQLLVLLAPVIAGIVARGQVYSSNSVATIQAAAAATGDTPPLPPPP